MFDQIPKVVRDHLSGDRDALSCIPKEHADAIQQEIADTVATRMGNTVEGNIFDMLSGNSNGLGVLEDMAQTLIEKYNLSPEKANTIAARVPLIMRKI
jgi:hypothetical protein